MAEEHTAAWLNAGPSGDILDGEVSAFTGRVTSVGHGLDDGDMIEVANLDGGAEATLVDGGVYAVRDPSDDEFALSATRYGPLLQFTADGSMTLRRSQPDYSARQLRQQDSALLYPGETPLGGRSGVRPSSGDVVTLTGDSYVVGPHSGVIDPGDTSVTGAYRYATQGVSGLLAPADAAQDRIDGLYMQVQDDDEDDSGHRRARPVYVTGEPAADPADPEPPAGALELSRFRVSAAASPQLLSQPQATTASGGVLPVPARSELPSPSHLHEGALAWDQERHEMNCVAEGSWFQVTGPNSHGAGRVMGFIDGGAGSNQTRFTDIDQSFDFLTIHWRGHHSGNSDDFSQLALRFNHDGRTDGYRRFRWGISDNGLSIASTTTLSTGHAGIVGSRPGTFGLVWIPVYTRSGWDKTGTGYNFYRGYPSFSTHGIAGGGFHWTGDPDNQHLEPIHNIHIWPGSQVWQNHLQAVLIGSRLDGVGVG